MNTHPLYETDLPIRDEILEAQAAAVEHWASQGTWWTAEERVAIVEEIRTARDAGELPPWVAPSSVEGLIPDGHVLPGAAIDVIWRLTNHIGSLTHAWYSSVVPTELSPERYVEIVGLSAEVALVDSFADALELARPTLPNPATGSPSMTLPDDVEVRTLWVPTAPIIDVSWKPDVVAEVPNVRKALSLVPDERRMQWVLIDGHYVKGGALSSDYDHKLTRPQMELIGARTSAANECFY